MSLKINIIALIVLGLSSQATATDGGHGGPICPASRIQTVTVTSTASCTEPPSSLQTSTTAYLETYTNAGPYVNASVTGSSAIPYTTEVTSVIDAVSTPASNFTISYTPSADPVVTIETSDALSIATLSDSLSSYRTPAIPTMKPNRCHHNNCLRQFIRNPQVSDFCATYTTTVNTATTDLPNYVSQCHADPTRISSACSCIATTTPSNEPISTKPQTTKTAGGVFTYPASPPTTADGCTLPSVVFETYTMTTTISVTVSADADVSTSMDASETDIEIVTSSAGVMSVTSIPYLDSSSASLATSTR
ncbi:hypothetical protein DL98DRAFT_519502 [Cadophora sp. DSE1049]|nr:hypothetical protein DL98DRAFT_519502 [Cadophora sp. DSE1049]